MIHATKIAIGGCRMLSPIGATAALAETTMLTCQNVEPSGLTIDGPATIELNESQATVTLHLPRRGAMHAITIGPVPATFADQEITFLEWSGASERSVINRVTGHYHEWGAWEWTCQAGHKQF